tara:strand:- start:348 stop:740 length:393 start_codon:yes stop_codon:yes gene_type:complete
MKPIIPPKYDIGFIIKNCNNQLLAALEPWCSTIYVDEGNVLTMIKNYIDLEQPSTSFNLNERVKPFNNEKNNEILVTIDGSKITQQDFEIITKLPEILKDSGEIGSFELGNLHIDVIQINTYEKELICVS